MGSLKQQILEIQPANMWGPPGDPGPESRSGTSIPFFLEWNMTSLWNQTYQRFTEKTHLCPGHDRLARTVVEESGNQQPKVKIQKEHLGSLRTIEQSRIPEDIFQQKSSLRLLCWLLSVLMPPPKITNYHSSPKSWPTLLSYLHVISVQSLS